MRLSFISDTHGLHRQASIPDGDVFIHAGDFMLYGNHDELRLLSDFNEWLRELPHKHKLVTCGNHDRLFETHPELARSMITNAILLLDEDIVIDGKKFYMTPWTPRFPANTTWWKFMKEDVDLAPIFDKIPLDTDVLVTHGPPFGILDRNQGGFTCGSKNLALRIPRNCKVNIFGHIHEAFGETSFTHTKFYNCSFVNELYKPVNHALVCDI